MLVGPGQSQVFRLSWERPYQQQVGGRRFPSLEPEGGEAYTEADHSQFFGELPDYSSQALCPTSPFHPPSKEELLRSQLAELVISPLCPVSHLSSPLRAGVRFPR